MWRASDWMPGFLCLWESETFLTQTAGPWRSLRSELHFLWGGNIGLVIWEITRRLPISPRAGKGILGRENSWCKGLEMKHWHIWVLNWKYLMKEGKDIILTSPKLSQAPTGQYTIVVCSLIPLVCPGINKWTGYTYLVGEHWARILCPGLSSGKKRKWGGCIGLCESKGNHHHRPWSDGPGNGGLCHVLPRPELLGGLVWKKERISQQNKFRNIKKLNGKYSIILIGKMWVTVAHKDTL